MNEHAGPACVLSVLIVAAFAILLHDKAPSPPARRPSIARDHPDPGRQRPEFPVAPSRSETTLIAPAPKPSKSEAAPQSLLVSHPSKDGVSPVIAEITPAKPIASPTPVVVEERPRIRRPAHGFTVVKAGESLSDVASRVYGSVQAAASLWKANRDQLASLDSPLTQALC